MKKLMIAAAILLGVTTAKADFFWSTWFDDSVQSKDVKGCVLGLASDVDTVSGAQIDLCISKANKVKSGAQFSFGYSRAKTLRNGVQLGFWNKAESASLQLGLICFNKTGFLPFFVFFNFDPQQFGPER